MLESGRPGQLALSGSQLALGYLDQTEATKQKFVERSSPASNEATSDLRRWYLTGDLGYTDPLGEIHLLGRIDRQIKLRGYRIELEEIDAHLREICGSEEVATVPQKDFEGVVVGTVAFVAGRSLPTITEIKQQLAERVSAHLMPSIRVIESLPITANGKVDWDTLTQSVVVK